MKERIKEKIRAIMKLHGLVDNYTVKQFKIEKLKGKINNLE